MRLAPLLIATLTLLTLVHVQSFGLGTAGTAGIGGLGGFLGFGVVKLIKLKIAAFLVASLLKKFQQSGFGKHQTQYYGGGGGGYPVYPPPPPPPPPPIPPPPPPQYGGGGGYRKKRNIVTRRVDALNVGLNYMYDNLAVNDESLCIPRVLCEVNVVGAQSAVPLGSELLHLFRFYRPKSIRSSPSYGYFKAVTRAMQLKDVKECVDGFPSCKVPTVDLLNVIGRLVPKSSMP